MAKNEETTNTYYGILMNRKLVDKGIYLFKPEYLIEGTVDEYDGEYVTITQKNYFKPGDMVEFISPDRETFSYVIPSIYDLDGNELECARHPEEIIRFKLDKEVMQYDMMRIKIK